MEKTRRARIESAVLPESDSAAPVSGAPSVTGAGAFSEASTVVSATGSFSVESDIIWPAKGRASSTATHTPTSTYHGQREADAAPLTGIAASCPGGAERSGAALGPSAPHPIGAGQFARFDARLEIFGLGVAEIGDQAFAQLHGLTLAIRVKQAQRHGIEHAFRVRESAVQFNQQPERLAVTQLAIQRVGLLEFGLSLLRFHTCIPTSYAPGRDSSGYSPAASMASSASIARRTSARSFPSPNPPP